MKELLEQKDNDAFTYFDEKAKTKQFFKALKLILRAYSDDEQTVQVVTDLIMRLFLTKP